MPPGQHYSGSNRIPNIKQFMERLDKDKSQRDAKIDAEASGAHTQNKNAQGEVREHQNGQRKQGNNRRVVRDPITGKDVEIDDIDDSMLESTRDPHVS